jgi:colanic acid/amylovoran biosynthesis glycosyltransferase
LVGEKSLTVIHSVSNWLPQTETWLYNQVRFLPPEAESHIVCEKTKNIDQFPLSNIHSLLDAPRWRYLGGTGLRPLRGRRRVGFLLEQVQRHHAQVLHSHFGNVGWADIGAAKRAGLKHIVTFYGADGTYLPTQKPWWRGRYRTLFEHVDLVLCEGPYEAQSLVGLGCPEHKIRVHHLGVRIEEIAFKPRVWDSKEPLRTLIAASFVEKKGIPYALEALGRLQRALPLEITIIGDARSEARAQAEKQIILKTIEKYNLRPKIRMLGYQPHANLFEEAYKHHLLLYPSVTSSDGDTEGGASMTIVELLATGMPVVSTRHCDIPMVIRHGVTGLLAEERDVNGLIRNLEWLVAHPERWHSMVQAGRRHVELEFNARLQGKRLLEIYEEVIS